MKEWQEEHIQALLEQPSEDALLQHLIGVVRKMGFDYCAYGIRLPLPISNPKIVMLNNYEPIWQEKYQAENYLSIDPTVQHGIRSSLPIVWNDQLFKQAPEFWEDARQHGLHIGWAQSCRYNYGAIGMLTLARSHEVLSLQELQVKNAQMSWLSQVAHFALSEHLVSKHMPEAKVSLSNREVEVLRWTAEGKTAADIADILRIAERTVNFHINNSLTKLRSNNKTQATIKAAALGFLG
ncbi:autoinducer binding domain-containing protein [Ampullimonas aquatilis]|uniref:autoinducer binding domain-containing protein n=1 Tax=Ampullimonas aquatilis TaxID=1341549 RepID=UPI003C70DF78